MRLASMTLLTGLQVALCIWTVNQHAPRIEADVNLTASHAVAALGNVAVLVDGRDVVMIGRVDPRDAALVQRAEGALQQSALVRRVETRISPVTRVAAAPPQREWSDKDQTDLEWDYFLGVM